MTYLIGTASLVWFIPTIGPKLMRINLREEGLRMQAEMVGGADGARHGLAEHDLDVRTYRVTNPALLDKTVAQLEALPEKFRVSILRLRHDGEVVEVTPTGCAWGRRIAILARKEAHLAGGDEVGPEVDDKALIDVLAEVLDVMVTNRAVTGMTLPELARSEYANGVFLRKLTRAGQEIPVATVTRVDRGDLVSLIGTKPRVDRAAKELGYPDRPTTSTDMVFVGTGIVVGGFVGCSRSPSPVSRSR